MAHEKTAQYLEGKIPKRVIVVPNKIVNLVVMTFTMYKCNTKILFYKS